MNNVVIVEEKDISKQWSIGSFLRIITIVVLCVMLIYLLKDCTVQQYPDIDFEQITISLPDNPCGFEKQVEKIISTYSI